MTKKEYKNNSQSLSEHPNNDLPSDNYKHRMIHPIIIYPYSHPKDMSHIRALYEGLIKELVSEREKYYFPITILEYQTLDMNHNNKEFHQFLNDTVEAYSEVIKTWAVDVCQRWLTGLGLTYQKSLDNQRNSDVFWLIPGDFDYASAEGQKALNEVKKIPEKVYRRECELCLGEITTPPNSSKQLIDTYGTYGLLYNWFPAQAQGIAKITSKPRTEFFAIDDNYLRYALKRRWYAYEQTIAILLHGMQGRNPVREIHRVELGEISDEPQGRESLAKAMHQVERIERVLKLYWRDLYESQDPNWPDKFKELDAQSEKIRGAAMVIFEQVLRRD